MTDLVQIAASRNGLNTIARLVTDLVQIAASRNGLNTIARLVGDRSRSDCSK